MPKAMLWHKVAAIGDPNLTVRLGAAGESDRLANEIEGRGKLINSIKMTPKRSYFLKSCRETVLVLLGVPLIIATIFAWMLYLMRNSNEYWGFFGGYEFDLSGGQVVIWSSDRSHHLKLDKPDLMVLVAATSICLLAWIVFMRWRSGWRRRSKAAFPLQLSTKAVEAIA